MPRNDTRPSLTTENHLYLYQLFSTSIGCGKQTFLPAVEQVLEDDGLTAEGLGFETTRELLEELTEFIELTIFKGGRVYATVIAQPTWDSALSSGAAENGNAKDGRGGKSWKRRRGEKVRKPVKPRMQVKQQDAAEPEAPEQAETEARPEAPAQPEISPQPEAPAQPEASAQPETPTQPDAAAFTETVTHHEDPAQSDMSAQQETTAPDTSSAEQPVEDAGTAPHRVGHAEPASQAAEEEAPQSASPQPTAPQPASPQPAPELPAESSQGQGEQTVASAQVAPHDAAGAHAAHRALPETYPCDFPTEVYCPNALLAELARHLPLGADTLGIANEYYHIALERGTLETGRSHFSFPLRYSEDGERRTLIIGVAKQGDSTRSNTGLPQGNAGLPWAIDSVEPAEG